MFRASDQRAAPRRAAGFPVMEAFRETPILQGARALARGEKINRPLINTDERRQVFLRKFGSAQSQRREANRVPDELLSFLAKVRSARQADGIEKVLIG